MCPRQGSNFLLLAQEKVTKEKGTLIAGRPRADCSALLGLCSSRRTRYAPCGRCAQTAARSQITRGAIAPCCKALRCSTAQKGPKSNTSFAARTFHPRLAAHRLRVRRGPGSSALARPLRGLHVLGRPAVCGHENSSDLLLGRLCGLGQCALFCLCRWRALLRARALA